MMLYAGHEESSRGSLLLGSMTSTWYGSFALHFQSTKFLASAAAPGLKLGTITPEAPLDRSLSTNSQLGTDFPLSHRSFQAQSRSLAVAPRPCRTAVSVRSVRSSQSTAYETRVMGAINRNGKP